MEAQYCLWAVIWDFKNRAIDQGQKVSTLKEISESKVTLQIRQKEGFFLSVARDLVTFSFLALCIYISRDSNWWTLVTGIMFLVFGGGKLLAALGKSTTTFSDPDDAIEYLRKWKSDNT